MGGGAASPSRLRLAGGEDRVSGRGVGAKATPGVVGSGLWPGDDQADGDKGDSQCHLRPAEPGPATRQGGQIRSQRDASDDPAQAGQRCRRQDPGGHVRPGPRGWVGDAGLTCCDGGRERWKGEVSVLMDPGCRSMIVHTIQPPGRSMSGQPDRTMLIHEKDGVAG